MVSKDNYNSEIERMRQAWQDEERILSEHQDREYANLLSKLSKALGTQLDTFDSLAALSTVVIFDNLDKIIAIVKADDRSDARLVLVESLLENREDIGFHNLVRLFNELPHDSTEISGARGAVAGVIVENVKPENKEEFLEMFEDSNNLPQDLAVLYYGLPKLKRDKRIVDIVRVGLKNVLTCWAAADAAKRLNATNLAGDVEAAIEFTHDKEEVHHLRSVLKRLQK